MTLINRIRASLHCRRMPSCVFEITLIHLALRRRQEKKKTGIPEGRAPYIVGEEIAITVYVAK